MKPRRLLYNITKNFKGHNWIFTFGWRFWGRHVCTVHVVRFRDDNYSLAFWIGIVGDEWPTTDQPMDPKWKVL